MLFKKGTKPGASLPLNHLEFNGFLPCKYKSNRRRLEGNNNTNESMERCGGVPKQRGQSRGQTMGL